MPFFQSILLLVMLFELIGSNDNDGDYHRIAVAELEAGLFRLANGNQRKFARLCELRFPFLLVTGLYQISWLPFACQVEYKSCLLQPGILRFLTILVVGIISSGRGSPCSMHDSMSFLATFCAISMVSAIVLPWATRPCRASLVAR